MIPVKKFLWWGLVTVAGLIWMLVQEDLKASMPEGWILALAGQLSDWLMIELIIKKWKFLFYNLALLLTFLGLLRYGWKIASNHDALVDQVGSLTNDLEELASNIDLKNDEIANLKREINELKQNESELKDVIQTQEQRLESFAISAEPTLDKLPVDEQAVMIFMGRQMNEGRKYSLEKDIFKLTGLNLSQVKIANALAQLKKKKLIRSQFTVDGNIYILNSDGLTVLASTSH